MAFLIAGDARPRTASVVRRGTTSSTLVAHSCSTAGVPVWRCVEQKVD
jgi:hypothetical protein